MGANVISCIGFTVFILLFGGADQQSVEFWTADKLALTAGAWTAGVAFQALILFVPMARIGIRYRPRWGLRGIGLRSMGPVAAWSVGVVVINQLANIINTRITTNAPETAEMRLGLSQFDVAGNATYQNAYTLFMLPYSLIAVSVATAMFPQISRALADHDLDDARRQLSSALRNVGVLMFFFAAAFAVIPAPITLALLPSVSVDEALLIAGVRIRRLRCAGNHRGCGHVPVAAAILGHRAGRFRVRGQHPVFPAAVVDAAPPVRQSNRWYATGTFVR